MVGSTPSLSGLGTFLPRIKRAGHKGVGVLQGRDHSLSPEDLYLATQRIQETCPTLPLLLNGSPSIAMDLGLWGVHHPDFAPKTEWREGWNSSSRLVLTFAAHGIEGIRRGESWGADALLISPVMPPSPKSTTMKPRRPLGWTGLGELVLTTPLPLFALGGLGRGDLGTARSHGAHGIAGIGAFF